MAMTLSPLQFQLTCFHQRHVNGTGMYTIFQKKQWHFYLLFSDNSVQNEPVLIIFGTQNPEKIDIRNYDLVHHTCKTLPLYLEKLAKEIVSCNQSDNNNFGTRDPE